MLDAKEIVASASDKAITDSRKKNIASEILKILSDNSCTVSEAESVLKLVDSLIANARIESVRQSLKMPPGTY